MKVLLTGSNGMVGKNLISCLPPDIQLLSPSSAVLDLLNFEITIDYLSKHQPELIIHAAGIVGGIQANINHPVRFLRENTLMGHNLIWAAYELAIPYFLNLGSSCMYPKNAQNPLKEEFILKGELEPTNEGYAISKIFAQRFCNYVNREKGTSNYKTIIPCNLYGRYDKFDAEWGHMIPSVIRKIHYAKVNNEPFVSIWGDGSARREFMFAADFADFVWFAVKNFGQLPETMNVGLGFDYSINDYYKVIAEVIGFKGIFKHDTSKPVGMKQKLVDVTQQKKLGWVPKTDLKNGIMETYQYFLELNN